MSVKRYEWVACDEHACHCDVVESAEGDMVDYEDYAALEARCAALAAENAGLNEKMDKLATWPGIEFYSSAWEFNNGDGNAALEFMCDSETPATDAFLAEVRAQGVEMFAIEWGGHDSPYGQDAYNFADKIRKGVQS